MSPRLTACKQTWKLSLSHPYASYSTCFSALGKVCEWVVALSSSSVCSGVSRSQEVIEFPLLKISISALAGNLPEMKWTADVYVCVNGGSRKGENALSDTEREGCNCKEKNGSPSKMFQERGKKKIKWSNLKLCYIQEKRSKMYLYGFKICLIYTWISLQILPVCHSREVRFLMKTLGHVPSSSIYGTMVCWYCHL